MISITDWPALLRLCAARRARCQAIAGTIYEVTPGLFAHFVAHGDIFES